MQLLHYGIAEPNTVYAQYFALRSLAIYDNGTSAGVAEPPADATFQQPGCAISINISDALDWAFEIVEGEEDARKTVLQSPIFKCIE